MQLSLNDLRELMSAVSPSVPELEIDLGLSVGDKVCIRTVTYHYCGTVVDVGRGVVTLSDASWLADSGRWSDFLKTGHANEVEMYPGSVHIALDSVVDWSKLDALPSSTK